MLEKDITILLFMLICLIYVLRILNYPIYLLEPTIRTVGYKLQYVQEILTYLVINVDSWPLSDSDSEELQISY